MPCQQCCKINVKRCTYVRDNRTILTMAPFEAGDTSAPVFDQMPTVQVDYTSIASKMSSRSSTSSVAPEHLSPERVHEQQEMPSSVTTGQAEYELCNAVNDQGLWKDTGYLCPLDLYPITNTAIQRSFLKEKYYGQSRWINYVYQVSGSHFPHRRASIAMTLMLRSPLRYWSSLKHMRIIVSIKAILASLAGKPLAKQ